MQKLIFSFIFISCLFLTACSNNTKIAFSETNTIGNTMFNYLNHSHTTSQDKWIFYNDYENNSGIYAQKKKSNKKILLVSDGDEGSPISIIGNELFYLFKNKLLKYDIKTEETNIVVDEPLQYFVVVKDLIYYMPWDDSDISEDPFEATEETQTIYSITTNGTNKKLIATNVYSYNFAYYNDTIYYVDSDNQFVSISLKNLQPIVLGKDVNPISCFMNGEFYFFPTDPYPQYRIVSYDVANNNWKTLIEEDQFIIRNMYFDENTIFYATLREMENGFRDIDKNYKYTISSDSTSIIKGLDLSKIHYVNVIDDTPYYYSGAVPIYPYTKRETSRKVN
ncbi:DUF5050 domain-containing protein [Bacillus sp. FJAT-49732]|uniref:DUF5050 domain-containing protein n=1 Tax=Lederbergia citrisecunda TaxID=2833583 RepID=A0A942TQU4_9BACI|nr:DUF5050 domain-containing protein [Lederbergia citrisecunda]MBS4201868.1 DUF5050 domain-containing protein [Lederbergia citrisecunda]